MNGGIIMDLGDFNVSARKSGQDFRTVGGNPVKNRMDFDKLSINDMDSLEEFSGTVQVPRILKKEDKNYDTAIIEIYGDGEILSLFVNFDTRTEEITLNYDFDFYRDAYNVAKSLIVMQNGSDTVGQDDISCNFMKFLQALDNLDKVTVRALEKENGYNTFIILKCED